MRWIIQTVLYAIGLPLEVLVVAAMIRARAYRTFPLVFAYAIALVVASLVEIPAYIAHFAGIRRARTRAFFYWLNEGACDVLIGAAVISLIYYATSAMENRTVIRRWLVAGILLFAAVSVGIHYDPKTVVGTWMTLVSRDISFGIAILDLALWTILILFRRGEARLLLISGGLGLQFTGEAIGYSLRGLPHVPVFLASLIVPLSSLVCSYVWLQTFRPVASTATPPLRTNEKPKREAASRGAAP